MAEEEACSMTQTLSTHPQKELAHTRLMLYSSRLKENVHFRKFSMLYFYMMGLFASYALQHHQNSSLYFEVSNPCHNLSAYQY